MVLAKLAVSNFLAHKVRMGLTIAAIALSVSLVVSVTTGYASLEAAARGLFSKYIGRTDAVVRRPGELMAVPEKLVAELREDSAVESAAGRVLLPIEVTTPEAAEKAAEHPGSKPMHETVHFTGIRPREDEQLGHLTLVEGHWFTADDAAEVVIDQKTAERFKVKVGDMLPIATPAEPHALKIVGLVKKPGMIAMMEPSAYAPLETIRSAAQPGKEAFVNRIVIDLKTGADPGAFADRWNPKLAKMDPQLKVRLARESRAEMDRSLQSIHLLSYLGGIIAMLAAAFIVFSALSMGVTERTRTLAMLRAIGAFKLQMARLVIFEAVLLALLGGMIGVPLGYLWMFCLAKLPEFREFFSAGVVLSWGGVAVGTAGSLLAALAASILPAWSATRVSPLEAMSSASQPTRPRTPIICAIIGLLLVSLDPLLMSGLVEKVLTAAGVARPRELASSIMVLGHFVIGLPGIVIGFFLLAPVFVLVVERLLGPIAAVLFGVRFGLLRQQLSSGLWRAAGTCAALMVGLATLVAMQIQGNSMLRAWKLPTKFPDVFIVDLSGNMSPDKQAKIEAVPGIKELMPVAVAAPKAKFMGIDAPNSPLAIMNEISERMGAADGDELKKPENREESVIFFGVDPDQGRRMMELDFRDNQGRSVSREEQERLADAAQKALKLGRHVLITDNYRERFNLKVGDKFPLQTVTNGKVDYTVAGIVWSPGLDLVASNFDLGHQIESQTLGSVFGTLKDAERDFNVMSIWLYGASLQGGRERLAIEADLKKTLNTDNIVVADVRELKYRIEHTFSRLLLLVSTVAFAAMAVASLGVTNTIMASIRSRRWQFGILRSIGVTRGQLLRMVLAEALLLGCVGCALGLSAGFLMSHGAAAMAKVVLGFNAPLVLPWGILGMGVAVVLGIALVASLWPAITTARKEPLSLLQAGRAAA